MFSKAVVVLCAVATALATPIEMPEAPKLEMLDLKSFNLEAMPVSGKILEPKFKSLDTPATLGFVITEGRNWKTVGAPIGMPLARSMVVPSMLDTSYYNMYRPYGLDARFLPYTSDYVYRFPEFKEPILSPLAIQAKTIPVLKTFETVPKIEDDEKPIVEDVKAV